MSLCNVEKLGDVAVMTFTVGVFHHENNDELMQAFDAVIDQGNKKIVVDMATTTYVSSLILASLVYVHKKAQDAGGNIVFCNVKDRVLEIVQMTNLDKVFGMADTKEDAIKKLG
jgi:anti-anti-sigma factor